MSVYFQKVRSKWRQNTLGADVIKNVEIIIYNKKVIFLYNQQFAIVFRLANFERAIFADYIASRTVLATKKILFI